MDWTAFFPARSRVVALPGWGAPRLLIAADGPARRWQRSALFPAFRLRARLYRAALRLRAAAWPALARQPAGDDWVLGPFVRGVLPDVAGVSVLVGSPGYTQKLTVQLWDGADRVVGYLKYAEKPEALVRLRHERAVLEGLPEGLGPRLLRYGALLGGEALVVAPLAGRAVQPALPPPDAFPAFCRRLAEAGGPPVALDEHPWVRAYRRRVGARADRWLERLAHRPWPVVVQHGDLVWNLRDDDGRLHAFDWEYGALEGFPGIDLASFALQTANMVYRWDAARALGAAEALLAGPAGPGLSAAEARAVVCLAAWNLFQYQWDEGWKLDDPVQQWRCQLVEEAA